MCKCGKCSNRSKYSKCSKCDKCSECSKYTMQKTYKCMKHFKAFQSYSFSTRYSTHAANSHMYSHLCSKCSRTMCGTAPHCKRNAHVYCRIIFNTSDKQFAFVPCTHRIFVTSYRKCQTCLIIGFYDTNNKKLVPAH